MLSFNLKIAKTSIQKRKNISQYLSNAEAFNMTFLFNLPYLDLIVFLSDLNRC